MLTPFADATHAAVYHLPAARRATVQKLAERSGYRILRADLTNCADVDAVLLELGKSLEFPDWYGANFDALFDCLTDPDCLPGRGHIVFVDGLEALRLNKPEGFATLIEVLQAAAQEQREQGLPLWVLLDARSRGVATLPAA